MNLEVISYKIYDGLSEIDAFLKEIEMIGKIGKIINKTGPLVNFSDGGSGGDNISNHPNIEHIKKKMSDLQMGTSNSFYGKKHTNETIEILREKCRIKNIGENNPFYGKKHTEESKNLISEKNKINSAGENNPFYGKKHTDESKEKMRQKHIGKISTEETKKKISDSLKQKNWKGENNPFATKYIIETPEGEIIEVIGLDNLNKLLKGLNPKRIISQKEHRGYKLINKIRINKK